MQNNIDCRQAVVHTEFIIDDPTDVWASEAADGILFSGSGKYTFSQFHLFGCREFSWPATLRSRANSIDSSVTIGVYPTLHEVSAAIKDPHNGLSTVAVQCQQYGPIAIPLFSITVLSADLTKLLQVLWVVKSHIHLTVPLVFLRVCQICRDGATLF